MIMERSISGHKNNKYFTAGVRILLLRIESVKKTLQVFQFTEVKVH